MAVGLVLYEYMRRQRRKATRDQPDVYVVHGFDQWVRHDVGRDPPQHDRVVASYTLLASVGGLSMQRLGLNVPIYDPQVH